MKSTYILIDPARPDYYKIGMTRVDINKRVKTLRCGNPDIQLLHYYQHDIENRLHRHYAYCRVDNTEWFYLTPRKYRKMIDEVIPKFISVLEITRTQKELEDELY